MPVKRNEERGIFDKDEWSVNTVAMPPMGRWHMGRPKNMAITAVLAAKPPVLEESEKVIIYL